MIRYDRLNLPRRRHSFLETLWSSNYRKVFVTAVLISLLVFSPRWATETNIDTENPFAGLYRNDTNTQCQETLYQPFVVGCPDSCAGRRRDLGNHTHNEPFYRLTMEWYLGQAKLHNHLPLPKNGTYFEVGYNYHCPLDFVDGFGQASDYLEKELLKYKRDFPRLATKSQTRMHVSLAYLCCLKLEEAYHVREIMEAFVHERRTFSVPDVSFERIECWKERFNSITHIVVVDNDSQVRLLKLLGDLEDRIRAAGIPVAISRLTQMPFHSTLLGVHLGNDNSMHPRDNIDPILNSAFQTLKYINNEMWPNDGISFGIQHLPKYSERPAIHTKLDKQS